MAQRYEKSPRQRTEWFGGFDDLVLQTSATDLVRVNDQVILKCQPRLKPSSGTINRTAFPAGIVRGESCSIARLIGHLSIYDVDRRQQNVSFAVGAGLLKVEVEDDVVADPVSTGGLVSAPDALDDLRASWLWHTQTVWNPQSAGANYTVFEMHMDVDSTNSRVFESNDIAQLAVSAQTLINSGQAAVLNLRVLFQWRCLLRLD